jgi:predicted negative regulator of RcsB-dependent stress response
MATQLNLEEQEQLDSLKAFWKRWGALVTLLLVLALAAYAGFNGWQWYQRDQSAKAAAMFDELNAAAQVGDAQKAGRVFDDLKSRYPATIFAAQGGLLAAKLQFDKGQADAALASLNWVASQAKEAEYQTVAQLRLAGLHLDAKRFDEALKALDAARAPDFKALVADRRGDVLLAQGKAADAVAAYKDAYASMDTSTDYRRLIEAKLTALGAAPAPAAAASAASAAGTK